MIYRIIGAAQPNMKPYREKGYIALITVLIVMAVVTATASTVALLSIGEGQSGFALFKGEDTLTFVEGCTEDALLKARADASFGEPVGTPITITRPEGNCSVTVVSKVGNTWTVDVTTQATTYKRTIQVIFDRLPTGITLTSWKEI